MFNDHLYEDDKKDIKERNKKNLTKKKLLRELFHFGKDKIF